MPIPLHRLITTGLLVLMGLAILVAVLATDMGFGVNAVVAIGIVWGFILWFAHDRPLEGDG
jgi:hypothetical protein